MYLEIFYAAQSDFNLEFDGNVINIKKSSTSYKISYTPQYTKDFILKIMSTNEEITTNYVTINKIIFDNFWILENDKVAIGHNVYYQSYKEYADSRQIYLDLNVYNNNCLFFMGELIFKFNHPIHEYIESLY